MKPPERTGLGRGEGRQGQRDGWGWEELRRGELAGSRMESARGGAGLRLQGERGAVGGLGVGGVR